MKHLNEQPVDVLPNNSVNRPSFKNLYMIFERIIRHAHNKKSGAHELVLHRGPRPSLCVSDSIDTSCLIASTPPCVWIQSMVARQFGEFFVFVFSLTCPRMLIPL